MTLRRPTARSLATVLLALLAGLAELAALQAWRLRDQWDRRAPR